MTATLEAESSLTDRYQTTVPETVRRVLKLGKRDKIRYTIRTDGAVVITRSAESEGDDPLLEQFLGFLARNIADHPEQLQSVDVNLIARIQTLIGKTEIDLDAPLLIDDE